MLRLQEARTGLQQLLPLDAKGAQGAPRTIWDIAREAREAEERAAGRKPAPDTDDRAEDEEPPGNEIAPPGAAGDEERPAGDVAPDPLVTRGEGGYYHPTCYPKEYQSEKRHGSLSEAPFDPADESPTVCAACGRPFDQPAPLICEPRRSGPVYWHRGCADPALRQPKYEIETDEVPPGAQCRECRGILHEAADAQDARDALGAS